MAENPNLLTSVKQRHGHHYETLALTHLQKHGLILVAQNWQQPKVGEIDLIMRQKGQAWDILVFVEVRKRSAGAYGNAAVSVTPSKQRKLIKTARYFLKRHPQYADLECRFDVMAFDTVPNMQKTQTDTTNSAMRCIGSTVSKNAKLANARSANTKTILPSNEQPPAQNNATSLINTTLTSTSLEWIEGAFIASAW